MMLNTAIVQVKDVTGKTVGAGFLVGDREILTCAHVVSAAIGTASNKAEIPASEVFLCFPFLATQDSYKAKIILWKPEEDIAGLQLYESPPSDAKPVRLVIEDAANLWGHPFRTFGFPRGFDSGVWSAGILLGPTAAKNWVQIETGQEVGFRIQPGFSGSPVWDEALGGVIGMVVARAAPSGETAFIITTSQISPAWTNLVFHPANRAKAQPEQRRLKVFLCHASGDKPSVRSLYNQLQKSDVEPWLDEENLLPGQRWQQEIPKAVRSSDVVIICLSQHSTTKEGYVQKEIKYALDVADEKPEDRIFLIPLRLEDCKVPNRLEPFQWVNLFEENGYERLMRSLRTSAESLGIQLSKSTSQKTISKYIPEIISILFLAADPTDASRLRLGEELREIQERLRLAKLRDRFELRSWMSVRPTDISQALLDETPYVIHFSGHGTEHGEMCFEDHQGKTHPISPDALATLFEQFSDQVHCVILNACYSESQAQAIAKSIDYVIGMNKAIGDRAAIAFSIGFYQALGAGRTIEDSYKFGCVQIKLQGIPENLTPILIKRGHLQS
jgi:hypothetical protein